MDADKLATGKQFDIPVQVLSLCLGSLFLASHTRKGVIVLDALAVRSWQGAIT